ncbi:MAG: HIT family protein [Dehalococcoidia bacterium]
MSFGDCIFCRIVAGESPDSVIYRDDRVIAFMDIRPVNPGHLLVIPIAHATYLYHLDEQTGMGMFNVSHRLAQAMRDSDVRNEGVNLFLADGVAAGQEVFHVHMHVIPRFEGDQMIVTAKWGTPPSRPKLDDVAGDIRGHL